MTMKVKAKCDRNDRACVCTVIESIVSVIESIVSVICRDWIEFLPVDA